MEMNFKDKFMLERFEQILFFSPSEMERRWNLVRKVMRQQNVDYLIILEGSYEGYNHWFIGNRDCESILFPTAGAPIVVLGQDINTSSCYSVVRPVDFDRWITRKPIDRIHPEIQYVRDFDARDIKTSLSSGKRPRIAFIHPEVLLDNWYKAIYDVIGEFEMFDIGMALDAERVIKSDEERFLIDRTNRMNEKLMAAAGHLLRPGRNLKSITDELQYLATQMGSGGHFVHLFCLNVSPQDEPSIDTMKRLPYPGVILHHGYKIFVLLETNGPGGYYSALGRFFILGKASEEMKKHWIMAVAAQQNAARLMKPGISVRQIFDENYKFIIDSGYKTNQQNYLHSLGFQYGEQPYLNSPSENTPLRADMCYIAHPVIIRSYQGFDPNRTDGIFALDTYFVTENGGVRANNFPQEIIELPF